LLKKIQCCIVMVICFMYDVLFVLLTW
jgi:hypothetical protein